MKPADSFSFRQSGSALVITLLFILILTILILTFSSQSLLERQTASLQMNQWEARNLALMGADRAREVIQNALTPLDAPFETTTRPDFFWAVAPGRLDLFDLRNPPTNSSSSLRSGTPRLVESIPLHSGTNTNSGTVDLNARDSLGNQPIWQGGPAMPVAWINVLKNPTDPNASVTNSIVGRYAFWVDDEGAKINVNTADGTYNYQPESYGQGTPSAVSLAVFNAVAVNGVTNVPGTNATRLIAAEGRNRPFGSLAEIGSRPGFENWMAFFATNSINLTTHNRSPDFNIFNEPKFQLIPSSVAVPGGSSYYDPTPRNFMIQWPRWRSGPANLYEGTMPTGFPYLNSPNVFVLRSVYPTPDQFTNTARRNLDAFMPGYANLFPGRRGAPDLPAGFAGALVSSANKYVSNAGNFNPAVGGIAMYDPRLFATMTNAANYLIGRDPFGNKARWPFADDAYYLTNAPSSSKYNLRQIDSITVQIFDFPKQAAIANFGTWRPPTTAPYGILQNQPVRGANGRFPHLVQVLAVFDYDNDTLNPITGDYDYGNLTGWITAQNYVPKNLYQPDWRVNGQAVDPGTVQTDFVTTGWPQFGGRYRPTADSMDGFNLEDWNVPDNKANADPATVTGSLIDYAIRPSVRNTPTAWSKWNDRLLSAKTASVSFPDSESGIDFAGQLTNRVDSDYRATSDLFIPDGGQIYGRTVRKYFSAASANYSHNFFALQPGASGAALGGAFPVGGFHASRTSNPDVEYRTRNQGAPIAQIILEGGMVYRMSEPVMKGVSELIPLDMVQWPLSRETSNTNSLTRIGPIPTNYFVLPLHPPGQPIILDTGATPRRFVVSKVRDPLINQLPGDWVPKVFNAPPSATDTRIARYFPTLDGNLAAKLPGNIYGSRNPFNAEPETEWVDMASMAGTVVQRESFNTTNWYNTPPQQSFPSVGYLQYLRTGAMPDNAAAVSGDSDYAGMPFRLLNFGPANTQGSIPDWAMLDLFTVPNAVWTKPATKLAYGPGEVPRLINLSYGGASTGKINLNGSVLFPWAATNVAYVRPMPLAAQFFGLRYNTTGVVNSQLVRANDETQNYPGDAVIPTTTGVPQLKTLPSSWASPNGGILSGTNAVELAEGIANYIRTNTAGILSLPGQMCDIPAVNAYGAAIPTQVGGQSLLPPGVTRFYGPSIPNPETPVINRTRNDIVSQSVGNFTTQGNVFSIWVVGQVLQKRTANTQHGQFEAGDIVQGEVRLRVILERQLDLGIDGLPGNAANPGTDGAIGTLDDPWDVNYHPRNPRFQYRILGIYEVQ